MQRVSLNCVMFGLVNNLDGNNLKNSAEMKDRD